MLTLLLIHTSATETAKDKVKVDDSGKVTLISDHGEKDGINTIKFSLKVKADENSDVSFEFEDISSAKITEYRYHEDENWLNIYISGTQPLFNGTDSLVVGTVKVKDDSGKDIKVKINAVEGSVKFVQGNSLMNGALGNADPNGDGITNIRDAAYIAQKLAQGKGDELPLGADYNGDGVINIRDAAAIARDIATGKLVV